MMERPSAWISAPCGPRAMDGAADWRHPRCLLQACGSDSREARCCITPKELGTVKNPTEAKVHDMFKDV
ncbi:unnamed protein product [Urochloa humidicola]